jgi:hypothetical protein
MNLKTHTSKSTFENGRADNEPRAGWNNGYGVANRGENRVISMESQLGNKRGIVLRGRNGTIQGTSSGSFRGVNPHNSSALPPLTTSELTRETQCIVLSFPTSQVADEQGASMRAIENQRNGESSISLRNAINWCRRNPRVRARFMQLMGCECETDPDFVQGISLLFNEFVRAQQSDGACGPTGGVDGARDVPKCVTGDLFSEVK